MDDELKTKLVEILSGIQAATKAAGDFALAQLPDIAQSYVFYGRAVSVIAVLFAAAIFICGAWGLRRVWKHIAKHDDLKDADAFIVTMGGLTSAAITGSGLFATRSALADAALVWLAPKVWLLQELARMLK